ncbi:MAG: hypothetical protein DCC71_25645 [Proteobacteria bacterium]|nr:MAG: hypothetical protein DCC71_25645 [Pseudomonadota bacterium]
MRRSTKQLAFALPPIRTWGGRRPGAGRKRSGPQRVPHAKRAPHAPRHPCHVTIRARRGLPSLRSPRFVRAFEHSFRELRARSEFRVVAYSLLPDHAHFMIEANDARALARGMKALGARIARTVHRVFRRAGSALADRYHARALETPREVRNALAYVLLNAKKHGLRFAEAVLDPCSSGRWFEGWRTAIRAATDPPAVSRARTWLLSVGWRRAGLIGPSEVPGVRVYAASARAGATRPLRR